MTHFVARVHIASEELFGSSTLAYIPQRRNQVQSHKVSVAQQLG